MKRGTVSLNSGEVGTGLIHAGPVVLRGVTVLTNGLNIGQAILQDALTASGTVRCKQSCKAEDLSKHEAYSSQFSAGIFLTLSGVGATAIIEYEPSVG